MSQFPYPITRPYGVYDPAYANYPNSRHPGTDYGTGNNTPLPAKMGGVVTVIDRGTAKTGRGKEVIITAGNTQIKYCHLNRIDVSNGQTITKGHQIGLSGYTGYVLDSAGNVGTPAGAHLHFEVLINGVYTNPENWSGDQGEDMATNEEITATINYTHWGYFGKAPAQSVIDSWRGLLKDNYVKGLLTIEESCDKSPDALKNKQGGDNFVPAGELFIKKG